MPWVSNITEVSLTLAAATTMKHENALASSPALK
jgi:hypothetical protein